MRWKLPLCGAMAALFACGPAMAQAIPVLSGKYATTYNEICQAATNTANYSTGAIYNQLLVADFDTAAKTVTLTGTSVYGPLVANGAPAKLAQTSINKSYPYSNTATTITIGKRHIQRAVRTADPGAAAVDGLRRHQRRWLFRIGGRDPAVGRFRSAPGPVAASARLHASVNDFARAVAKDQPAAAVIVVVEIEHALDRAGQAVERRLPRQRVPLRRAVGIVERIDPAKAPIVFDEAQDGGGVDQRVIDVIALGIRRNRKERQARP